MDNETFLNKITDKTINFYGSILYKDENINQWLEWRFFFNKAKNQYNIIEPFSTF